MYEFFRTALFKLDPERAHHLAARAARLGQGVGKSFVEKQFAFEDPRLQVKAWGLTFTNPIGLAAGFDKNARLVPFWESVGFGFCEVGSVTARRSKGNPKPRLFRLPEDEALVNRLGLNNEGASRVARRLRTTHRTRPIGINIAKTHSPDILGEAALEDFRASYALLAPLADYVVLNISCPNTAEGKTFEEPRALDALLHVIAAERDVLIDPPPLLLKLAPPESRQIVLDSRIDETIEIARRYHINGFVATNTTPDRQGLETDAATVEAIGRGGLSGKPLEARSTQMVRYLYDRVGPTLPIIGLGGVDSAQSAYRKIRAGASLVELYTGLVYHGPELIRKIKEELVLLLYRDGFNSIRDAVGRG